MKNKLNGYTLQDMLNAFKCKTVLDFEELIKSLSSEPEQKKPLNELYDKFWNVFEGSQDDYEVIKQFIDYCNKHYSHI